MLFTGLLHVIPALHGVKTLFGQTYNAFGIIDPYDYDLDLLPDLDHVLRLNGGIVRQLVHRYVAGMFRPKIHIDLSRCNGSYDACDLLPRMQSFDRLLQQFSKGFLDLHVFSVHFVKNLLYDPRRCRCACGDCHTSPRSKLGNIQFLCIFHPYGLGT